MIKEHSSSITVRPTRVVTARYVVHESFVLFCTDEFDYLSAQGPPNRSVLTERQRIVGTPPSKLGASLSPVAAFPFPQNVVDVATGLYVCVVSQRHLPADVRFPVHGAFAASDSPLMERTAGSSFETRTIQHYAGVVDHPGDRFSFIVDVDRAAHFIRLSGELPLVGTEAGYLGLDRGAVLLTDEVRSVGAAPVLVLGRRFRQDARAAAPVDAAIVARQERQVEVPGRTVYIGETNPLSKIRFIHCYDGNAERAEPRTSQVCCGDTVTLMASEFEDICNRLEAISEELADLAIMRLRESIDAGGQELPVDEKRLTRARRAVEKAIHLLAERDETGF